ncbi:hypothetical protein GCM10009851_34920 [Herbiconiux moechotypicola]|uniref:Enoyl reductase (ER) domain-containing protein n=1 Tax=Herbiconiux moechotypicola TaxID=637393 RepID=A0ABP5QZT7_9MICO
MWDAAWRRHEGTTQEYVVLPSHQVEHLPAEATFDLGASLGIPALTAHRALTSFADGPAELIPGALRGKTVLIQGGTGAVGHSAVQLAVWSGAEVITTVGDSTKEALARTAGAHHVINYRDGNIRDEIKRVRPGGVDIIVEVNARSNLPTDMSVIAPHGGISIYTAGGGETRVPSYQAMTKNVQFSFILTYTTAQVQKEAALRSVGLAVASGALNVGSDAGLPITRFPLSQASAAHLAVERHVTGKVLIDVATGGGPA